MPSIDNEGRCTILPPPRTFCIATQYAVARFRDGVVFSIFAPEWPTHFPTLQRLTGRTIGVGLRPEHVE